MPNLDPWMNQSITGSTTAKKNKLENHLLSLNAEHQKRIQPNLHSSYNAYHEKLVELITRLWNNIQLI